jgi:hypothetical protein
VRVFEKGGELYVDMELLRTGKWRDAAMAPAKRKMHPVLPLGYDNLPAKRARTQKKRF